MESVFYSENYKDYVLGRIKAMPSGGKGQLGKLAKQLGVHTSFISHVFRGEQHLSADQAYALTRFFGLGPVESEYFLALVQFSRAETPGLKAMLKKQLVRIRDEASGAETSSSLQEEQLSEMDRATFYSNWYYSGIRLITSLPNRQTCDSIAAYFGLPTDLVQRVIDFLVAKGLCVQEKGRIKLGAKRTWLEPDSPMFSRHHINWRLKGMERIHSKQGHELYATLPMVISKEAVAEIRSKLIEFCEEAAKSVEGGKPEQSMCLNVDWFEF